MNEQKEMVSKLQRTIKDARGRSVTQLDPVTLHLLRRHDVIEAEPLAQLAGAVGSGLTRLTRFLLVLGAICALPGVTAFAVHLIKVLKTGGMVWPLPKWLFLANLWVVPFVLWMSACQLRSRRIRSVMLKHRRCPHCGYDLRLLPIDPEDGATVCPECGCAWRLASEPATTEPNGSDRT